MSKRILELEKSTWIQAYQIRNFELGVLQKKTPWILSKHINCYYDSKAMGIFNHCMPEKRYFTKFKALIVQRFRYDKSFLSFDILNFIQWAKNLIDGGWYIMGYYDEYYIPETASYQYRHFRHTMLIYGYDDESQLFYAMGYTSDRKYRSHCLTLRRVSYEHRYRAVPRVVLTTNGRITGAITPQERQKSKDSLLTGDAFGVQEGRLSRYSVIRRLLRNKKVKKYRTKL